MAEHESAFAAAVAAVRPLLLGGTIRDAERVVLAVLRAAKTADATGAGLSGTETDACCVCGSAKVVYRNYRDQPFCGPCADGNGPQDGQSGPVPPREGGEAREGANCSSILPQGLSEPEAQCGTADPPSGNYFPHVCGRDVGHEPPHICERDDCRKHWTTEDEPHAGPREAAG